MVKTILITGARSYVGTSFEEWMKPFGADYHIDTLDMRNPNWKDYDFSMYDSVFHVAGIAHADVSNVSEKTKQLYYQVNTNLTIEVAEHYKKLRKEKESQFIFMSSIIIYGEEITIHKKRIITKETSPKPSNFYGDSKLQAEIGLEKLKTSSFNIAIIRPPMIYGPNSKGNYQQLEKLALKLPIFPDIRNERSMISIDHLCSNIKEIIDEGKGGIYFPQDDEYVRTSHMVQEIAKCQGKNIILFSWMNWAVKLLGYMPGKVGKLTNKAFGSLVYEKNEYNR